MNRKQNIHGAPAIPARPFPYFDLGFERQLKRPKTAGIASRTRITNGASMVRRATQWAQAGLPRRVGCPGVSLRALEAAFWKAAQAAGLAMFSVCRPAHLDLGLGWV